MKLPHNVALFKIGFQSAALIFLVFLISPLGRNLPFGTFTNKQTDNFAGFFPQMGEGPEIFITGDFAVIGVKDKGGRIPGGVNGIKASGKITQETRTGRCDDLRDLLGQGKKIQRRCNQAKVTFYGIAVILFLYFVSHAIHVLNDDNKSLTRMIHTVFGLTTFIFLLLLMLAHYNYEWDLGGSDLKPGYGIGYYFIFILVIASLFDVIHHIALHLGALRYTEETSGSHSMY